MRAETHTEVYRPFKGKLKTYPFRARTLAWSGIRIGFRKKLPALLLFTIPAISTIVTCFLVQLTFEAKSGAGANIGPGFDGAQVKMLGVLLEQQLGKVEGQILRLLDQIRMFLVLAMGWYGSGLIAEDKRLRANLLYFARPLTRWTYFLGKLGTVLFWGFCAMGLPVLIVCSVAAFSSPEWSFVTERWPVILKLFAYAGMWIGVHALLVLAISSLVDRRNHALAGLFGFYILTTVGAEAMSRIFDGAGWRLISLRRNFERIAESMFGVDTGRVTWPLESSLWALGFVVALCIFILQRQTRKMEVGQ